jgi:hypothetical protein
MGTVDSKTSVRARQARRLFARWQRSGLTLRQFAQQRGIPLSTMTWWRQAYRRDRADVAASGLAVFTRRELDRLREVPDDMFRAVRVAKRAFPGSKVVWCGEEKPPPRPRSRRVRPRRDG